MKPEDIVRIEHNVALKKIASEAALNTKRQGVKAVIVAVSTEHGGHSFFHVTTFGPCLEVEGLAARVAHVAQAQWSNANSQTQPNEKEDD